MKFIMALMFLSSPAFADVLDLNKYGGVACSDAYQMFGLRRVQTHISYFDLWTTDSNGTRTDHQAAALKIEFENTNITKQVEYEDETGKTVVTEMVTDVTVTNPADSSEVYKGTVFCRKSESEYLD